MTYLSLSYNEVEALIKRAARGVNQSWSVADESARAVRWLAQRGMAGPATMMQLLELYDVDEPAKPVIGDNICWQADDKALLCPVITGAAISDFAVLLERHGHIHCINVACPLLVLPFAAQASQVLQRGLSVECDDWQHIVANHRIASQDKAVDAVPPADACPGYTVTVKLLNTGTSFEQYLQTRPQLQECMYVKRARVESRCWARLSELAHRTYAPASEESRRLGAGAAESDND